MTKEIKEVSELLERPSVPALDAILGKKFPVLDDGFIRLIDYMGDDSAIVQAARVSYGKGTKKVNEDAGLIRYLMRHRHTTPFEMCELKIHVRVPMDCWRQWIRHRTANVNEYSTRYSEAIDSAQSTKPGEWRCQASSNKQGSSGFLPLSVGTDLSAQEEALQKLSRKIYNERIAKGVAREQARKDLPLATYTEAYWKIDLKNLLHFLALRMDSHAQKEIRDFATVLGEQIVALWLPTTWQAFNNFHTMRNAMVLTEREIGIVKFLKKAGPFHAKQLASSYGWLDRSRKTNKIKRNRERSECEEKFEKLGLDIPWLEE
jgi:thymidylate synthase (FAD)